MGENAPKFSFGKFMAFLLYLKKKKFCRQLKIRFRNIYCYFKTFFYSKKLIFNSLLCLIFSRIFWIWKIFGAEEHSNPKNFFPFAQRSSVHPDSPQSSSHSVDNRQTHEMLPYSSSSFLSICTPFSFLFLLIYGVALIHVMRSPYCRNRVFVIS